MIGQGLKGLFKAVKPRQFNYKPVFYDERKEWLENRKKSVLGEMSSDESEEFRKNLKEKWQMSSNRAFSSQKKRTILIASIIAVIAYYLLYK